MVDLFKDRGPMTDSELFIQQYEISEIIPNLYLSSYRPSQNAETLAEKGVTHIINLASFVDCAFPDRITYYEISEEDEPDTILIKYFNKCHTFIDQVIGDNINIQTLNKQLNVIKQNASENGNDEVDMSHSSATVTDSSNHSNNRSILVHCNAGLSRSATIVVSYLMKKTGWSLEDALIYTIHKRPCVQPNEGFLLQLQWYQEHLRNPTKCMFYEQEGKQWSPEG